MAHKYPPPPPRRLYKYTKRQYLDDMLTRGVFQIGTLHGFRDEERLGVQIGDAGEGTRRLTHFVEEGRIEDLVKHPLVSKVIGASTAHHVILQGVEFQVGEKYEDVFLFCTSRYPSRRGLTDFGADVCVKIEDSTAFFQTLTRCLHSLGLITPQLMVGRVVYADRTMEYDNQVRANPAALKPKAYRHQREVRAIWRSVSQPIQKVLITCPDAAQFLSVYEF